MTTDVKTPAGEETLEQQNLEEETVPAAETFSADPGEEEQPGEFVFREEPSPQEETIQLLRQMCQSAQRQEEHLRAQLKMTRFCAGFLGGMLAVMILTAAILLPWIGSLAGQAQQAMGDLQVVTENLSRIDFAATIEGVDKLVVQSGTSLETALKDVQEALATIEKLDIDGLNAAISDLQKAVKPLANLFGGK